MADIELALEDLGGGGVGVGVGQDEFARLILVRPIADVWPIEPEMVRVSSAPRDRDHHVADREGVGENPGACRR